MAMSAELLRLIERKTGKTIERLRSETLCERRRQVEAEHGSPMQLLRLFPFIGRGSVMGEHLLSRAEVERQLDRAIR